MKPPILEPSLSAKTVAKAIHRPPIKNDRTSFRINRVSKNKPYPRKVSRRALILLLENFGRHSGRLQESDWMRTNLSASPTFSSLSRSISKGVGSWSTAMIFAADRPHSMSCPPPAPSRGDHSPNGGRVSSKSSEEKQATPFLMHSSSTAKSGAWGIDTTPSLKFDPPRIK